MKIKLTSVYVDDQEKALRFYTEVLGFAKKADFRQGPFRWLTVSSPEDPNGTELQLGLNDNPALLRPWPKKVGIRTEGFDSVDRIEGSA
jgi:catechol 2,3-dioxygenase-like lactoylglutathione lyase family enzyme